MRVFCVYGFEPFMRCGLLPSALTSVCSLPEAFAIFHVFQAIAANSRRRRLSGRATAVSWAVTVLSIKYVFAKKEFK